MLQWKMPEIRKIMASTPGKAMVGESSKSPYQSRIESEHQVVMTRNDMTNAVELFSFEPTEIKEQE